MNFTAEDIQNLVNTYAVPWAINIAFAILIFVIGRIIVGFVVSVFTKLMGKSKYDPMLVNFLASILKAVLTLVVIVAALNKLNVDTTSLVAIIGAAGLAIGLSLQDSLKNFAAGVMLLVFKPIRSGDYVDAGGSSGVVKHIGIFTTTMNTPDNKEVIVPNGAIYGGTITNYSVQPTRRVDMVFGIGYNDDLLKAKNILIQMFDEDERILKEPEPVVVVAELGDSSVNFAVRPWAKTEDFWGVKGDFTEKVKLRFDAEGISIPFPQMDVHLHKQESAE